MSDQSAIDAATKRLAVALDALEAAVARRHEADRSEEALAAQLHVMGTDRARLAAELDSATAQSRRLETSNREVARRLDDVMESIRSVLPAAQER
jgi:hypothetical protein